MAPVIRGVYRESHHKKNGDQVREEIPFLSEPVHERKRTVRIVAKAMSMYGRS